MKIKRLVKLSISGVFFAGSWTVDMIRWMTGASVKGKAVILYYHGVRPEHRAHFARQMDALIRWAKPVHADQATCTAGGGRFAAVTFDDGFVSFADTVLPELRKRNIPSTLFVVVEKLGTFPEWPEYIEDPQFKEPLMTYDQMRNLPSDIVNIGSHTLTHPRLTHLPEVDARTELLQSRLKLEEMLDRIVPLFSFPFGAFNEKLVGWCRDAGYQHIYTTLPELAFSDPNAYALGRVGTDPLDSSVEFFLKLHGAYCWLPVAFGLKRRVLSNPVIRRLTGLKPTEA